MGAKAAAAATEAGRRMRKAFVYAAKLALISIPTGFLFALAVDLAGGHHQLHTFGTLVIAATPLAFHRPVVVVTRKTYGETAGRVVSRMFAIMLLIGALFSFGLLGRVPWGDVLMRIVANGFWACHFIRDTVRCPQAPHS